MTGQHARRTRDHPQGLMRRARWIGSANTRNVAVSEKRYVLSCCTVLKDAHLVYHFARHMF